MKKQTLIKIGLLILSFLFIFGAVSKLISMPFFDGMVAELFLGKDYYDNPSGMFWTQWLGRILVAAELVIGIALLQNKWFKSVVLPATMVTLVLFTIHLFYEGFSQKNGFTEGNCGCFGDVLPMTNLESIFKNIIAMIIGIYVWLKYQKEDNFSSWVSPTMLGLVTIFTLSFGVKSYEAITPSVTEELGLAVDSEQIIDNSRADTSSEVVSNPIDNSKQDNIEEPITSTPSHTSEGIQIVDDPIPSTDLNLGPNGELPMTDLTPTTKDKTVVLLETYAPDILAQNLGSSSRLVCLFSMTCSHCQEVYGDLSAMKASGKLPSMYLVNYGSEYEQNYFFTQAGNAKDGHSLIEDFTNFKRMLEGKSYPRILYIKNGKIVKEWDVDSYKKEEVMKYYGIEKLEEKKNDGGLQLELEEGDSPW